MFFSLFYFHPSIPIYQNEKRWVKIEVTAPSDIEYKFLNALFLFWEEASGISSNSQFKKQPKGLPRWRSG